MILNEYRSHVMIHMGDIGQWIQGVSMRDRVLACAGLWVKTIGRN